MHFTTDTLADRKADRFPDALEIRGLLAPHQRDSQRFRSCRDTAEREFQASDKGTLEAWLKTPPPTM